ncbi:MAG: mechanosensitive ion channel [Pseudomonas sp.]
MFEDNQQLSYISYQLSVWGPKLLAAIVILVATYLIAKAVRWALTKGINQLPFLQKDSTHQGQSLSESIGALGYWLVWLIGLLVALQPLGLTQALEPINILTSEVMAFLPRIIGAGIILFVGILIARIVRTIVETALGTVNWQKLCARFGQLGSTEANSDPAADSGIAGCGTMIRTIGAIVFALIVIPVAISALQTLGISSIVDPTVLVLHTVLDAIPRIFAAALLLAIAYFIAQWVRGLLEQLLVSMGFDNVLSSVASLSERAKPSRVAGWIVLVAIMLFAAIEAARLLNFEIVAVMLSQATELGGKVVFGSVIVVIGVVMARLVARLVGDSVGESGLPSLLKYAIIALAVAMGLRFMGLANEIVNLSFGLILGSAAVACALAFGLGGRETAHRLLQIWVDRCCKKDPTGKAETDRPDQSE